MIDIELVRENPEKVRKGVEAKGIDPSIVNRVAKLDKKWRGTLQTVEKLRHEKNVLSKDPSAKEITKAKKVKQELKKLEDDLKKVSEEYEEALRQIPNLPADDVPVGKDESENKVVRDWGEKTKFEFKARDHLELGAMLDIIDVERAAKVSGSRFGYLKGDAVLLELALVNLAMETLTKEGFYPVVPPVLVRKEAMQGMGYMEHMGNEEFYLVYGAHKKPSEGEQEYYLVGTSEQSIGPMHMEEVFEEKELPKRYIAFSPCFRREAGSYGKDTRGIFRVHQFDKVEMFSYTKPEESEKEHENLLELEEKLFQALELPYQVVEMCTGDLGAPAAKKYDIEAWIPSQEKYREMTSTSNTTDFQARRLNIKYKKGNELEFVHTLNGTAFAIGRTIIAILENNQKKDGTVVIPKVLQEYMGKEKITPKSRN